MTTGTGIIIATVIFAIVALLIATKDRWTWRKLFLYPALILAVVTGIIALAVSGYSNGYYGPNKIGREMEYAGIRLRSTKSDVQFVKGKAKFVATEVDALKDDVDERWLYSDSGSTTVIGFGKDGLVDSVAVSKSEYGSLPSLKWINGYTSLKSIQDRLGEAHLVDDIDGGLERNITYPSNNIVLRFSKDGLRTIVISDFARHPYKLKAALDQNSLMPEPVTTAPGAITLKPLMEIVGKSGRTYQWTKPNPPTPAEQAEIDKYDALSYEVQAAAVKSGFDSNKPYTIVAPAADPERKRP